MVFPNTNTSRRNSDVFELNLSLKSLDYIMKEKFKFYCSSLYVYDSLKLTKKQTFELVCLVFGATLLKWNRKDTLV